MGTDVFQNYRLAVNRGQVSAIAGQLLLGQTEIGLLSDVEPEQVWLFDGLMGELIAIQALGELDFSIRLENSLGAVLASSQFDPITGQVILPPLTLPIDDTYRVMVSRAEGVLGDTHGRYRIRLSNGIAIPEVVIAQPLQSSILSSGMVENTQNAYYLFYAEPTTPVSLEFVPVSGKSSTEIRILNQSGELITTSTGTIENLLVSEAGYYLIEISNPTPLTYTLTYAERSLGTPREPLERDVTTVRDLTPTRPVNYWSIEATAGESLVIELSPFAPAMRSDLVLFDPDGIPFRTYVDGSDEIRWGPIFIPRSGTYTLRVGTWLNLLQTDESGYSVRVRSSEEILGSEGGVLSDKPVFGGVSQADPFDTWTFEGQAGSSISIDLRTTSGDAEMNLELIAPDETPMEIVVDENGNSVRAENILLPYNGTYTLHVVLEKQNSADATAYELTLQQVYPSIEDALAQAQGISIGESVVGEISTASELDAWVFFVNQGQTITVTTQAETAITLISPNGISLYASENGFLEQVLLLEEGLYSVVIGAAQTPLSYTLLIERDRARSNWRWTLALGNLEQAALTYNSPVHEWLLTGYYKGEYTIVVRPSSQTWQAKAFVLNEQNQVVVAGEPQADGSVAMRLYLDSATSQKYHLLVTADTPGGIYQVLFDAGINATSPELIVEAVPVTGRISAFNTADEWLWQGNPSEPLTIEAVRLEGNFNMSIRVFAPGNLFLQEFFADENGFIRAENILLPVQGTYIIQVVRTDDLLSDAQGLYEMRVEANPAP